MLDNYHLNQLAEPLLAWFVDHARVLPWRERPEPYRVWVSEIMLQQTRVEAVKPYYERFLKALPDVAALAACPEDQLMKLWEGLGYYNRVRNMQKAAVTVTEEYGGVLPADYGKLLEFKRNWFLHSGCHRIDRLWDTGAGGRRKCAADLDARGGR